MEHQLGGNSPNTTFENEDTIKLESSIASSSPTMGIRFNQNNYGFNDQDLYQFDSNAPFIPVPPMAIAHSGAPNISSNAAFLSNLAPTPQFQNYGSGTPHNNGEFFNSLSHYSIFSNPQAAMSANSLHNSSQGQGNQPLYKLNIDSTPELINNSITGPQSVDLMYNLELGNHSLDSIPNSMIYNSREIEDSSINSVTTFQPNQETVLRSFSTAYQTMNDFGMYPYTPTINDVYTPTLSDTSFTPNSSVNNTTTSTNEEYNVRGPAPLMYKPLPSSTSSHSLDHKISKKLSITRLNNNVAASINNKKGLMLATHISNASNSPLGELSPKMSPLCNKYKAMELHLTPNKSRSVSNGSTTYSMGPGPTPISSAGLPQMDIFRHNSDSSASSYVSSETPRRKTYPTLKEVVKKSRKTSKKVKDLIDDTYGTPPKPKKYTRRRLLPRSKNGCWICRIKHLKCDEVRPICAGCAKFGIDCDYSPEKPDYVIDKNLRKEKLMDLSLVRKLKQSNDKEQIKHTQDDRYASSESLPFVDGRTRST